MTLPRTHARTEVDETVQVTLTVNGAETTLDLPPRVTLSDALRDHLGLTGTHVGCEHGICGMCTVLVDGEATRACLLFAVQVDRAEVTTVEGLGRPDDLHPLQEAFGAHHGLQCGFCTPGFLMSSYDLLAHQPAVSRDELAGELSGVLCRCTGYRSILEAVGEVAETHGHELPGPKNCGARTLVGRAPSSASAGAVAEASADQPASSEGHPDDITVPAGEPTVRIDLTTALEADPGAVGGVFDDVRLLARCLPGAELTDDLGDGWYRGRASVGLGPMKLAFQGVAHVTEQTSERIVMDGQGKDAGGGAQAHIEMTATPSPGGGTSLHATASVFLTGRIAGFGRSLAGDVSRRMFEDFARSVDRAAAGEMPDGQSTPPGAVAMLASAVADRARSRYQHARARVARWRRRRRRG